MSRREMLARVQRAIFFVLWHDDVKALWLNLNAAARAESKTEAEQEQPPETRARASTKWRVPSSPWRPLPTPRPIASLPPLTRPHPCNTPPISLFLFLSARLSSSFFFSPLIHFNYPRSIIFIFHCPFLISAQRKIHRGWTTDRYEDVGD